MKSFILSTFVCLITNLCSSYVLAADAGKGGQVYAANCEVCHANNGQGVVADTPDFRFGDNLIKPDVQLFNSISSGKGMMPAFRGLLSEQDILNVISYLRTLH